MLCLSSFCVYIKLFFVVVAFHAGVYWPLLGVWQIQSCYLAVGRMLKSSAPILTQARYCMHTTLKNPKMSVQRWHMQSTCSCACIPRNNASVGCCSLSYLLYVSSELVLVVQDSFLVLSILHICLCNFSVTE